jgi:putative membrane protein
MTSLKPLQIYLITKGRINVPGELVYGSIQKIMVMKNLGKNAKWLSYAAFAGMSMFFIASCDNGNPDDTKEMAEDENDARFDERKSEKDAEFLVDAAEINLEEIKLGELAQQKGTTNDVKELGKMMVQSHTNALKDLKNLAANKSVALPGSLTEDGQEAYDKLNEKSGADFNKDYCDMMVKGHKNAIERFEWASSKATDSEIRNWASAMLPTLNEHLEHSNECLEKCKAMK